MTQTRGGRPQKLREKPNGRVRRHIVIADISYRKVTYTGSELTRTALSLPDMTDTTGRSL